jgi:mono/diheme cytochrome c family protein
MVRNRFRLLASAFALLHACAAEPEPTTQQVYLEPEPLATGEEQQARLCTRGRSDAVLDVFCARQPPAITSVLELRSALGMLDDFEPPFALTAHSTSLALRGVSAINPRALFIREPTPKHELLVMAFARGEQFTEVVTRDRATRELQFYLVTYDQPCNDSGCLPGDLLTEAAEVDWQNVNVYAEEDLANTPFDCRTCHQPDGPGTPKLLRMQELQPPWNHWFYTASRGGRAVIDDYLAAKGGELFAGLTSDQIFLESQPGVLAAAVSIANPVPQNNLFVSAIIEDEVTASAAKRGGAQPVDNTVPGESPTWRKLYDAAKRGEAIAVPYHDVKVTDKDKLAAMTAAYVDYREGRLPREELPDIRDVFPDDEELLARMGFATEPGMTGEEVLMQACAQCHNSRLDQTLSRARFNVDLSELSREQKERAISRIMLPIDHGGVMPPARFRHLSDEAKEQLIELLER